MHSFQPVPKETRGVTTQRVAVPHCSVLVCWGPRTLREPQSPEQPMLSCCTPWLNHVNHWGQHCCSGSCWKEGGLDGSGLSYICKSWQVPFLLAFEPSAKRPWRLPWVLTLVFAAHVLLHPEGPEAEPEHDAAWFSWAIHLNRKTCPASPSSSFKVGG